MDSTRDARLWKLPRLRFAALCRQTSSAAHDASPEKKNIASNEKITMVEVCTKPKLGKGFHQNTDLCNIIIPVHVRATTMESPSVANAVRC